MDNRDKQEIDGQSPQNLEATTADGNSAPDTQLIAFLPNEINPPF